MKSRTKLFLVLLIIVVFTITIFFSVTYAFFTNKITNQAVPIEIDTGYTEEELILNVDKPLTLTLNSENLSLNGENVTETSTATIRYKKRENVVSSSFNYYLYLVISDNTFVYSDGTTPEMVLSITKDDVPFTSSLGDLTYNSSINGYDITTKKGIIPIAVPNEITSTSSDGYTTHVWKIKLTYVNLDVDQGVNFGSILNTDILLQKTPLTFANYLTNIVYTGTDGDHNIYKHDGVGTYTNASEEACWLDNGNAICENSYRYSGTNPDNYVCFGYSNPSVCTGSNFKDSDYVYRIIGVFNENDGSSETTSNQVKLIKANWLTTDYIGEGQNETNKGFYWQGNNSTENNTWEYSTLNTDALNTRYINVLGSSWTNLIESHKWKVGGNTWANVATQTVKTAYVNEIATPNENGTSTNGLILSSPTKIGLMYVSDYEYAVDPNYWLSLGYNSNEDDIRIAKNYNWMFTTSAHQWTISRISQSNTLAFLIGANGNVDNANTNTSKNIRPAFYLKSNVNVISGNGTIESPYIIG